MTPFFPQHAQTNSFYFSSTLFSYDLMECLGFFFFFFYSLFKRFERLKRG